MKNFGRVLIPMLVPFLFPLLTTSCASIKVQKAAPLPPSTSKPGLTMGSNAIGGLRVESYWCDVHGSFLTFGASGPTEAKATEIARARCHGTYPDSPCELVACKRN